MEVLYLAKGCWGAVCPPSRTWSGTPPEDIFDPKKHGVSDGRAAL